MKKAYIFSLIILTTFTSQAQITQIQWANKVINVSTQNYGNFYRSPEYHPNQVLGIPDKFPQTGLSPLAWSTAIGSRDEQYITVGFSKPVKTNKIYIAENHNPGAVIKVLAYDSTNKEHLIYENKEAPPKEKSRMWEINIPQTKFSVHAIALILISNKLSGRHQIDAIGISDVTNETKINTVQNIPKEILKENLGKGVNSRYGEVAPIITPDGKTLYFTRTGHNMNIGKDKAQDVWFSKLLKNDNWGEAENIKSPINTDENNAISTISADRKTLYLINIYLPDGTLKVGISKSVKSKTGWSFPKEVKIEDYYNLSQFTEFSLAPNGKTLVMACQRKDTHGSKDLYVSFLKGDSLWSKPINMGHTLNTAENESSPFIAADSKTIYFSTAGFAGYGDSDIFLSRRLDSTWTNWSKPENLGNLINTPKWDGYFTMPASGEYAYMSSEEKSIGREDIFRIKLFPSIKPEPVAIISGTIINDFDKNPLTSNTTIELFDNSTNEKIITKPDPETGEYMVIVPIGKTYDLRIEKDGFLTIKEALDLTKKDKFVEIKKDINLIPVK